MNEGIPYEEPNLPPVEQNEPRGMALNRPVRIRRLAISNDYVVYSQELDFECGIHKDPISFSQAINSYESGKWIDAMK